MKKYTKEEIIKALNKILITEYKSDDSISFGISVDYFPLCKELFGEEEVKTMKGYGEWKTIEKEDL